MRSRLSPRLICKLVQTFYHAFSAVAELVRPNDGSQAELALPGQRFLVDDEPRLARSSQHVVTVKILMDQDPSALAFLEGRQSTKGSIKQFRLKRTPGALSRGWQLFCPARSLFAQRDKRLACVDPKTR